MLKLKKIIPVIIIITLIPCLILIFSVTAYYEQMKLAFQKKSQIQSSLQLDGIPAFITSEMILASLNVQANYGYPASVCIAQIIQESGFGNYGPGGESGQGLSYLAFNYKNLFGIKGRNGTAGGAQMTTHEETASGETITIVSWFRSYNTYTECIDDRASILSQVYSDLISGVTNADEFARQIGRRWATDSAYAERLISHMQEYNLYRLDSISVADFTQGVNTADGMPYYYQDDYANVPYGSSTLAASGCGPTSFAMVASSITGKQITPEDAISWCGNAYYVSGVGTAWSYFSAAANHFNLGISITQLSPSSPTSDTVLQALRNGKAVICSQGPGLFTRGGHFIVLSGIDDRGKISVHDPNKNNAINRDYNNRKFDFYSEINITAKQYFIFQ